jgi:diguanylate cyclase (GGDEF)-like protein
MLDIDHFKAINDHYGHLAGDEVLRNMVSRCLELLRDADLFTRFGGEEFMVLLPHTDLAQARDTAERLRSEVASNITQRNGKEIAITISIGVSCLKASDTNFESVIKRVDDALYEAKNAGRNCVMLSPDDLSQERAAIKRVGDN